MKDLTDQLRKNYLELNSATEALESFQKETAADKERLNQLLRQQRPCQSRLPRPADND